MPSTETVRALVSAFNVHNYARNTVKTNFKLQSEGKKNYIVVSFDRGMDRYQCSEYLDSIKRKIIREFYGIEESNDAEILDTAKLIFDVNSFPFDISNRDWSWDKQHGFKFVTPVDEGVIFNLKSHLASSLKKDILEGMPTCSIFTNAFDKKKYLWRGEFDNKGLRKQFEREFLLRMRERYENAPKNPLKVEGNSVYIKDVFDDARFIDSVIRYITWLKGMGLQADSKVRSDVKAFKELIMEFIDQPTKIIINGFVCASPLNRKEASILIPLVLDSGGKRILTNEEALKLNYAFSGAVFNDLYGRTQGELLINKSDGIYSIDFSNPEISHRVITKIIESSVINKDHELSIDPELRLQALSPAQSPFNSPTHAEPPRTPPKQRQEDRDSGYDSNSPPKPKDSVAPSPSGVPRSLFEQPQTQELPTRNQGGELKESPRQGSEKEGPLYDHVDVPGTSKEFSPRSHLNSIAVNRVIEPEKCVAAAENVPTWTSTWSLPTSRAGFSSWSPNGPSSFKSTPAAQPQVRCSLPPPPPLIPSSSNVSGSQPPTPSGTLLWKVAAQNVSAALSQDPWSQQWQSSPEPGPSGLPWNKSGSASWSSLSPGAGFSSWKGAQAGANISKKEEKLIKALLYTFNLTNYTYGGVYTNFFAKDGKIVSCLHDNVDREKYFQAVRNYIIKEYYEDEKEASKVCDLDEFPFKLNCEEKQETTVVANISSGALSNLKILFSQKFGKSVDAIDISAVKKVEEREKDEWVDRQLFNKDSLEEACEDCFPDEEAMKIIPIAFEEGEYMLDRSRDTCEVKLLLREQLRRFRGTSVAGKGESDDKPLTEEEKELFKALLYAFNYSNRNFELPNTNFIVKNEKIVSLINDDVDVKEYLKEVRDDMIKGYYVNEKEAYYLNEFPFKFLSNCEKNQETTVVANISRGASFNLKKIFISCYGGKMEEIDTNIVKEEVKSGKHRLVELKERGIEREAGYRTRIKRREAVAACYPDEGALEDIPIGKCKTGYYLDRTCDDWETESFAKQYCAEGTSVAGKVKPEDNKDSGISSGEATDAENVSSKAEATTSSGYESMDCENTREGSPKRSLELSMESLPISTTLNAPQPSPAKKLRRNEV